MRLVYICAKCGNCLAIETSFLTIYVAFVKKKGYSRALHTCFEVVLTDALH